MTQIPFETPIGNFSLGHLGFCHQFPKIKCDRKAVHEKKNHKLQSLEQHKRKQCPLPIRLTK
jgi:hypothetical protein